MKTKEQFLIDAFNGAKFNFEQAEDRMNVYFKKIVNDGLDKAKSIEDIEAIKEKLRPMPACASKVFLFRMLIISEKQFT